MKNNNFSLAFLLLISCLISGLAFATPKQAGRVVMATSGVTAQQPNKEERQLARKAEVFVGDLIKVPQGAKVQILLQDGELLALIAKTELVIEDLTYQPSNKPEQNANIKNLVTGGLRSISGAVKEDNYQVKTRAGTIGIRGTAFETITEQGDNLFVKMQEGTAFVKNDHGIAEVSMDETNSAVAITNINEAPKSIPPEELPPSFDEAFAEDAALDAALEDVLAPEDFAGFILQPTDPLQTQPAKAAFYRQLALTTNKQQLNLAALNPQSILNLAQPTKGTSFAALALNAGENPFNLLQNQRLSANYWQQLKLGQATIYTGGQLACVTGCFTAQDLTKEGVLLAHNSFIFANNLQANPASLVNLTKANYQLANQQPVQPQLDANPLSAKAAKFHLTHAEIEANFTQQSIKINATAQLIDATGKSQTLNLEGQGRLEDFYDQGISLTNARLGTAAQLNLTGRFIGAEAQGLIGAYSFVSQGLLPYKFTTQANLIFSQN